SFNLLRAVIFGTTLQNCTALNFVAMSFSDTIFPHDGLILYGDGVNTNPFGPSQTNYGWSINDATWSNMARPA
ncbi:MAG: hypothetical protein LBM72_01245, partial [Mycoplasmataceae bacterium]|nr:hypothetical protein [Mycoplasmataceae bacterium]